tara:strand:+ start:4384 stop:4596 length:213 start_codon:yes stop_codon:yes gene_type:complete
MKQFKQFLALFIFTAGISFSFMNSVNETRNNDSFQQEEKKKKEKKKSKSEKEKKKSKSRTRTYNPPKKDE